MGTYEQADKEAITTLKRIYALIKKGQASVKDMADLREVEEWLSRQQEFGPASHVRHLDPETGKQIAISIIDMVTGKTVERIETA